MFITIICICILNKFFVFVVDVGSKIDITIIHDSIFHYKPVIFYKDGIVDKDLKKNTDEISFFELMV